MSATVSNLQNNPQNKLGEVSDVQKMALDNVKSEELLVLLLQLA